MANNRYAEDIRIIAGVDNLAGGIGSQPAKQPIQGGRGIAYFNADGTIGSDSGTKGETTQPEDAADASAVTDGDGNTGDDITHEPVSDSGVVPVEDLFNGNMGIGDSFTGVNGLQDCATGQEYEVRGDGQFNVPEGWEETPPDGYEAGHYWESNPGGATKAHTAHEICSIYSGYDQSTSAFFADSATCKNSSFLTVGYAARRSCSTDPHALCDVTPIQNWPTGTPAQLTWDADSSAFITNPYDGNVSGEYKSNNVGLVELCDSEGNQYSVAPSKDGGLVFTDVTNNIFIVRNNNGKITAAGSGSIRDQYVAK